MAPFAVFSATTASSAHVIARGPASRAASLSCASSVTRGRHLEPTASPWYPKGRQDASLARSCQVESSSSSFLYNKPHDFLPGLADADDVAALEAAALLPSSNKPPPQPEVLKHEAASTASLAAADEAAAAVEAAHTPMADASPPEVTATACLRVTAASAEPCSAASVAPVSLEQPVVKSFVTPPVVKPFDTAPCLAAAAVADKIALSYAVDTTPSCEAPWSPGAVSSSTRQDVSQYTAPSCSERSTMRCNSVTVKVETSVKDAAGAIVKVLDRMFTLFMTALRSDDSHEALNRAVKSLAVARKYIQDTHPGWDLTFLPLHRTSGSSASNCEVVPHSSALPDPNLFAFLVFKTIVSEPLKQADETDLNVSRGSDINKMANAIMSIVLARGQAVMKAGGAEALYVAMSAIINARHRLQRKYCFDLMVLPAWMTEDTTGTLGRESKFLRFNILKCSLNGPMEHTVRPMLA